jgi:hypothetical protein
MIAGAGCNLSCDGEKDGFDPDGVHAKGHYAGLDNSGNSKPPWRSVFSLDFDSFSFNSQRLSPLEAG